ncbi:hypothetical protein BX265_6999 [Streptomyces sp. TLI_235]|nr:hypothetical protein BX265_6999 [Streptomyces sp. TLI_235]
MIRCTACPEREGECPECQGIGEVGGFFGPKECRVCRGDGCCRKCNGKGFTQDR